MKVCVSKIVAWAPGLETPSDWSGWAKTSRIIESDNKPKVAAVPANTRRRLARWGRMSLEVASACIEQIDENTPCIFASRHGDTHRTLKLLETIAKGETLSPTAFSLSVHNSSVGIFSIVQKLFAGALAIAGGKETLAEALVAAFGLLSEGHKRVLLVQTDEPLASFYQCDEDEKDMPYAFAMVLSLSEGEPLDFNYSAKLNKLDESKYSLGVNFLQFWYNNKPVLNYTGNRLNWRFSASLKRDL